MFQEVCLTSRVYGYHMFLYTSLKYPCLTIISVMTIIMSGINLMVKCSAWQEYALALRYSQ